MRALPRSINCRMRFFWEFSKTWDLSTWRKLLLSAKSESFVVAKFGGIDLLFYVLFFYRWSDLVAESIVIMRELPLSLSNSRGSWSEIQEGTEDFKRKYHTIVVHGCHSLDAHALEVFRKFGPELRRLEIESFAVGDEKNMWNQVLETCERLEFLKLTNSSIPKGETQNQLNLKHLRSVFLDSSSWEVSKNNWIITWHLVIQAWRFLVPRTHQIIATYEPQNLWRY